MSVPGSGGGSGPGHHLCPLISPSVLCCTVLYCALYCAVLCPVLCCTALYCILLQEQDSQLAAVAANYLDAAAAPGVGHPAPCR